MITELVAALQTLPTLPIVLLVGVWFGFIVSNLIRDLQS
jgi:hypothetical protein